MDPLTHTLVGANLASSPLGTKTQLGAAALVIGANLPDVDAILYFTGHSDLALGFRRGWTHGVLALVLLPLLQTALLMLWARLRGYAEAVSAKWLLILSSIGILTHPALDWLNTYGMRWLMPFRGTWFYGDSVYIMDPWLWLILGCGWLAARRPTAALIGTWVFFSAAIAWVVGRRSSGYLVVVGIVALVLLAALLWRSSRSLAVPALVVATIYIFARLSLHWGTVAEVRRQIGAPVTRMMTGPHPLDPTRWDVVAQTADHYRYGSFNWRTRKLSLAERRIPVAQDSPEWRAARRDPSIRGFITWNRFPWYEVERGPTSTIVRVHDARRAVRQGPSTGAVVVIPASQSLRISRD